MRYDLAAMTVRAKKRRRGSILLRNITPPAVRATDLYTEVYAPVIAVWADAAPAIVAQYAATLAQMTRDSPEQVSNAIGGVDTNATRVVLAVKLRVSQWAFRFEAWQRGKWQAAVKTSTGIDVSHLIGPGDVQMTVQASIERNVSLVRSVSEQTRQRISEAVFGGLNRNETAAELAKAITAAVEMSRARAKRIAADQLVKINAQLGRARRQEAGIDAWEWVSSHKLNYRPEHHARNGKRYTDETAPSDLPGMLPYCGCTERAVLSLDGEF